MARFKSAHSGGEAETQVDISPLIDCVFILLIFFIVTTVFVKEPDGDYDKPRAASQKELESNSIMIGVTADGQVLYSTDNIGIAGVRPLVKRMTQQKMMPVIIRTDKSTPSGVLVRVIEESKLAGAEQVNIATLAGE